jgi:bifunctional ADP-heptose synthase (sugar kinase/adenylyltransferase)
MAVLDTRTKIVTAEQLQAQVQAWRAGAVPAAIVTGLFDPLLAAHAELLEGAVAARRRVVVQLEEGLDPVLPLRDRAELVAALRCVDLVCQTVALPADYDFRAAHLALQREFRSAVVMSAARP